MVFPASVPTHFVSSPGEADTRLPRRATGISDSCQWCATAVVWPRNSAIAFPPYNRPAAVLLFPFNFVCELDCILTIALRLRNDPCRQRLSPGFRAVRFRAGVSNYVPLSVKTRDEHRTIVRIAPWLIGTDPRSFASFWCHISKPLTEAAVTKLGGTAEKLYGIVSAERSYARLHGPVMLVAEGQNVCPHGGGFRLPSHLGSLFTNLSFSVRPDRRTPILP